MIRTLNDLKTVLLKKSSWGFEIVFSKRGYKILVYLHAKEFAYVSSYVGKALDAELKQYVVFKKQSRFWDLKMWWRSL